jgi:hypothetical protein
VRSTLRTGALLNARFVFNFSGGFFGLDCYLQKERKLKQMNGGNDDGILFDFQFGDILQITTQHRSQMDV